jgi:2-amino-4-hydroxy-6-hydroxymethyldihydropteridine diphosphokinase
MPELAYIGIGSNLGDRNAFLTAGIAELAAVADIDIEAVSSVYETAPVGYLDQPSFLNAVFAIRTALPPLELLHTMQRIESDHQRQRQIHWGPRTLDLDLLLYRSLQLETEELTLPHPHLAERLFVLAPLCEIAPDLHHPETDEPFAASLKSLDGDQSIRRVGAYPLPDAPHPSQDS